MKAKPVSDIMIYLDEYPAILNTATIAEAIEKIESFEIDIDGEKSLPRIILVIDKKDHLVGLVNRRGMFRGLEPEFIRGMKKNYQKKLFNIDTDPNLLDLVFGKLIHSYKDHANRPVEDIMIKDIITINYDDHIFKAINIIAKNDITLLPVINKGKVVGVVRTVELLHEVARLVFDE